MKRQKSRGSRPRNSKSGGLNTFVPFGGIYSATLSAGSISFQAGPNVLGSAGNIARLHTIEDAFGKYRFTKLKFRLLLNKAANVAGVDFAVCYVPRDPQTAAFTTIAECFETQMCSFLGDTMTTQPPWVTVPRKALAGLLPWYQTLGGSTGADTEEEYQGTFYVTNGTGAGTTTLYIEIKGVCEFGAPLDPANTPVPISVLLRQKKELDERLRLSLAVDEEKKSKARQKLLTLLNYTEVVTETKWPQSPAKFFPPSTDRR